MLNIFSRIRPFWNSFSFSSPRAINSLRTTLACLIGYLIVIFSHLPQSQWIVITIIIVMSAQISIGSFFIKAKMRFWGTFLGALAAVAIILLCGNNPVLLAIAFFIAIICFTYTAGTSGDISLVGTLGAVTVAFILLAENTNLIIAFERFTIILIGLLIATGVSYFVFPIRSHSIFLANLHETLSYLQKYFENSFRKSDKNNESFLDLDEKMTTTFVQQRRLILEMGQELGSRRKDQTIFQEIIQTERRIYRAINLIYYSLNDTTKGRKLILSLGEIKYFKKEISDFLLKLSGMVKSKDIQPVDFLAGEKISLMEEEVKKILSGTEYSAVFDANTFLFAAKFLVKELSQLKGTIDKINSHKPPILLSQ